MYRFHKEGAGVMMNSLRRAQHRVNSPRGFTIIEVAVAAVIMVLIGLVVAKFMIATSEAFTLDSNTATLKQQSERAMETMAERIRKGMNGSFVLSNGNSTLDFVDATDGSQIQYTLTPLAPVAPVWGEITQTITDAAGVARTSAIAGYARNLQFAVSGTGRVTINGTFTIGRGRTQTILAVQAEALARN
jgi:type II secretory pathway pseudopilin PulG